MNLKVSLLVLFLCSCSIHYPFFPEWETLDEFNVEWYSEHLRVANEKPIIIEDEKRIYRLTWLRTFHEPIIIRIECELSCNLIVKKLSGKGGYEPGTINKSNSYKLSKKQIEKIEILFTKIDGWVYKTDPNIIMMDGSKWILEVAKDNKYQAWDISSPNGNYRKFCEYMIKLSELDIPKGEYY